MKDFEKRFRFFNIAVAGLVVFMIFHLLTIQTNANVLTLTEKIREESREIGRASCRERV